MIIKRKNKKTGVSFLSMDSLADIVSNSLGMIIIIMVNVAIIALFRENFAGTVETETVPSAVYIDMPPPDKKDILPYMQSADSHSRPVFVICYGSKIYTVRLDLFYERIYTNLLNSIREETFVINDVEFLVEYSDQEKNLPYNAQYRPVATGGVSVHEITSEKRLAEVLGIRPGKAKDIPLTHKRQYFYFAVYPDGFKVFNMARKLALANKFNLDVQVLDMPWIYLTGGIFTTNWSTWSVQE